MNTKHTPGPWATIHDGATWTVDAIAGKRDIATVIHRVDENETAANARLIAAAPELLAACKATQVSLIGDEHYAEFRALLQTLDAAIAKATGQD